MRVVCIVAVLLTACGDDDALAAPDASTDAAADARIPATPPALPLLTPCPPGWREIPPASDGDVVTCDPWPESGHVDCPTGQVHFAGGAGCEPVSAPCPSGDFPDVPAGARALYVRPGATSGDGSLSRPYGSLSEAIAVAVRGDTVVLAKGDYVAGIGLPAGVTLAGACAEQVRLSTPTAAAADGVVTIAGDGTSIRDLAIVSSPRVGIMVVAPGATVDVRGVAIEDVEAAGLSAIGPVVITGERIVVRDMRPDARTLDFGRALIAQAGASVELSTFVSERNLEIAVFASGAGTNVVLSDLVVRDTRSERATRTQGVGIDIQESAHAEVRRAVIEGSRRLAIFAGQNSAGPDAATFILEDAVVRDTLGDERDGSSGRAITLEHASSVELRRVLVERNRELGVFAGDARDVMIEDVVLRDIDSELGGAIPGSFGRGFSLRGGSQVTVSRALVERCRDVGVWADETDSTITLEDLTVRDVVRDAAGVFGASLVQANRGAQIRITRAILERSSDFGVLSFEGSAISLDDVVVRDVVNADCPMGVCLEAASGLGLGAYGSATLTATRFGVMRAAVCGVQVAADARLELHDGVVAESSIGACVQVDGYDLGLLMDRVAYLANGTPLQATTLPIPTSAPP